MRGKLRILHLLVIVGAVFYWGGCYSYTGETHPQLSKEAASRSSNMARGIEAVVPGSVDEPLALDGESRSVDKWIQYGAEHEDDTLGPTVNQFFRYKNHFYDPVHDVGFEGVLGGTFMTGERAPDWALGVNYPTGQFYSLEDAKKYLVYALTIPTRADREAAAARMFRALGQVMHVLQDMAQPQHTRNDNHAFARKLYERYVDENNDSLPFGAAPIPVVTNARNLFTKKLSGTGLAEFSNGNFVSEGTNFVGDPGAFGPNPNYSFPVPLDDGDLVSVSDPSLSLPQEVLAYCPKCLMHFISSVGADGATRKRTATYSLFASDLSRPDIFANYRQMSVLLGIGSLQPFLSLNRVNFDIANAEIIPRAVAYSEALLDYFFRGKMEIFLPAAGVYSIVDHAQLSSIDNAGGFAGFDTIKLMVKNATPNGEQMTNGTLQAILKYRRALGYDDGLGGYPPFGYLSTTEEEIVLSDKKDGVSLGEQPQEYTFNFTKALPINAIDVKLQLLYRGVIGEEKNGVAFVTKDIAEPTFITYVNSMDYVHLGGEVYSRKELMEGVSGGPDSQALLSMVYSLCVNGTPGALALNGACFKDKAINTTLKLNGGASVNVDLPKAKDFARIAFLADHTPVQVSQTGECRPESLVPVDTVKWSKNTESLFKVSRGLKSWMTYHCVWSGDLAFPDFDDYRMSPLQQDGSPPIMPVTSVISGF